MIRLEPNQEGIRKAAEIIRQDGVVVYPTETVYGLAANPLSTRALDLLFRIKGRPESNPVLLVVSSEEQMRPFVREITAAHRACMAAFWPGPLSLLFEPADAAPAQIIAGSGKVCIRHTAHPVAQELCGVWGGAITSTSANRSGQPAARSPQELELDDAAIVLDGGLLPPSAPSTVFDPLTEQIIREGAISGADLLRLLHS